MATLLPFDELNSSGVAKSPRKKRSIPYAEYFGVMGISEEQKEARIQLALLIEDAVIVLFSLATVLTKETVVNQFMSDLLEAVGNMGELDDYVIDTIRMYANEVVDTTYSKQDFSEDRAMFIAEDMSNTFENYFDYVEALKSKKYKVWHTQNDIAVRHSHKDLEGEKIPVKNLFKVGDSYMRFPKDTEYGASPEEYINCRCWVEYTN